MTNTKRRIVFVSGAGLAVAMLAHAQTVNPNLSPGLWSVTVQTDMSAAMSPDMLARIPEDRRAQFMAMMNQAKTHTQCVKPSDVRRGFSVNDAQSACKTTVISSTPTSLHLSIACPASRAMQGGDIQFSFPDAQHATGTFTMTMVRNGQTHTVNGSVQAMLVKGDCGE